MLSTGGTWAYAGGGNGAGECVCGYEAFNDRSGICSIGVLVVERLTGACRGARDGVCAGSCARMEDSCSDEMTPVSVRNSSSYNFAMLENELSVGKRSKRTVLMVRRLRFERAMETSEEAILEVVKPHNQRLCRGISGCKGQNARIKECWWIARRGEKDEVEVRCGVSESDEVSSSRA